MPGLCPSTAACDHDTVCYDTPLVIGSANTWCVVCSADTLKAHIPPRLAPGITSTTFPDVYMMHSIIMHPSTKTYYSGMLLNTMEPLKNGHISDQPFCPL